MKPRILIPLLLFVTGISAAAHLFLNNPSKSSSKRTNPTPSVTFQWGEGSEAGQPDTAAPK
jgi:hypothetical protein